MPNAGWTPEWALWIDCECLPVGWLRGNESWIVEMLRRGESLRLENMWAESRRAL